VVDQWEVADRLVEMSVDLLVVELVYSLVAREEYWEVLEYS